MKRSLHAKKISTILQLITLITQKPHPEWVAISHEALKIRADAVMQTQSLKKKNPSR